MIDLNKARRQRDETQPTKKQGSGDPLADFQAELAKSGLSPKGLVFDGNIHRFDVDKRRDNAGWYVGFNDDGFYGAGYGSWKGDFKGTWCSVNENTMTYEERTQHQERMKQAQELARQEAKKNHAAAKIEANKIWDEAAPVYGQDHPYLMKKNILAHNIRVNKKGELLIPSRDEKGELWSIQRIFKNGDKKFQWKGRRKGLFFEFEPLPGRDKIYIAESYSTGATVAGVTGCRTICAFNAYQLESVGKVVRKYFPNNEIIIAADNDQWGKPPNIGIKYGKAAALKIGATFIYPVFPDYKPDPENPDKKGPTDFNDLYCDFGGSAAVTERLSEKGDATHAMPPVSETTTDITQWLTHRPKDREYILHCHGNGWLPKGIVGVIAATGGVGKTFFLMGLSHAMATGGKFGPIEARKPLKVLCIYGEDDQDELGRRYWDICDGKPPKGLHVISVYGNLGPLMQLDEKRNPAPAAGFHWFKDTIKKHPDVDIVIFDPKSRFYGLDENSNDHATRWVQCLEQIGAEAGGINILFTSHTSESNAKTVSQQMNRGASALVDGCRWQAGMAPMDEDKAKKLEIEDEDRWKFVLFDAPKNNYSPRSQKPMIFERGDKGALKYRKFSEIKNRNVLWTWSLCNILKDEPVNYTLPQLEKEQPARSAKHIFYQLTQFHQNLSRKKHSQALIATAVKKGWVEIVESRPEKGGPAFGEIQVIKSALPKEWKP